MNCDCPACNGRDVNLDGIQVAEKEVIPFFKEELLKLRYPTHPFPLRYDGLLAATLCYGQAVAYGRTHSIVATYHTENKWMLKFSEELFTKFGLKILHKSELKTEPQLVCEYNANG